MTGEAKATIQVENERTRVTEWRFAPGTATGFHRHDFDYVVVPMTTANLRSVGADGEEAVRELVAGQAYAGAAGLEHDVVNDNDFEVVFVEIEVK